MPGSSRRLAQGHSSFSSWTLLTRLAYFLVISALSAYVLFLFLTPVPRHAGIDDHPEARFEDMLDGSAGFPFKTRVLLPQTVNIVAGLLGRGFRTAVSERIESSWEMSRLFERLHWNTSMAGQYFIAAVIMLLCFIAFADLTAKFTILTCSMTDSPMIRGGIALLALLGVPAFFKFTSFIYDPPQLFLFSGALYFLVSSRTGPFLIFFTLATLNKETAVLLIPLWFIRLRAGGFKVRPVIAVLPILIYGLIRISIYFLLKDPGDRIEFHFIDHNVQLLVHGYGPVDATVACLVFLGLFFQWDHKPRFLRSALLCTLPPLLIFALALGYLDEWRDYYEIYPVCFGLLADTVLKLSKMTGEPS